ncbi:hypothetical protein BH18ACI4_BH18ACI4_22060 [soil metagenome]
MNIPARALLLTTVLLAALSAFGQTDQQRPPRTGEATITIKEQFFNSFLDAIFDNLRPPSTPLFLTDSDKNRTDESAKLCLSAITLQRENSGVKTAIKFAQGKIIAPLAFSGAYNSTLLGCLRFRGVAYTEWGLEFDRSAQVLLARIKITDMRLENVPSLAQSSIVTLVQSAIDARINPLKLLRPEQLSGIVPIASSGGSLRLRTREVKPEIVPGLVHLHLTYEFLPEK